MGKVEAYAALFVALLVLIFMIYFANEMKSAREERDNARARFTALARGLRAASIFTPETGVDLPGPNDSTFRVLLVNNCPGQDRVYMDLNTFRENGSFGAYFWTKYGGYKKIVVTPDDVERYF